MNLALGARRSQLAELMEGLLEQDIPAELKEAFRLWMDNINDPEITKETAARIRSSSRGHRSSLRRFERSAGSYRS